MIQKKTAIKEIEFDEVITKVCDKCGVKTSAKSFDTNFEYEDPDEWQGFHSIRFMGGFGSCFGDGTEVECDLCHKCLKELIGKYCRYDGVNISEI